MPVDDDYYWARENVGIRELSEEEYKSKAAAKALETISMQIRTTVSGVSTSNFKETETEFGSAYYIAPKLDLSSNTPIYSESNDGQHVLVMDSQGRDVFLKILLKVTSDWSS